MSTTTRDQTRGVLDEVFVERLAQDDQWGGPEHDDQHRPEMWDGLIWKFLRNATYASTAFRGNDLSQWYQVRRKALMQCAALCVAAIEAMDRKRA